VKNTKLLNHEVNKTFEEILWMNMDEFRLWCKELRETVVDLWDNHGLPPRVGYDNDEIIEQFKKMESFHVHKFSIKDDLTGEKNVIRNTHNLGNCVNDWFPTMMKTRINYSDNVDAGRSIYDFFALDELYERFVTYATRHFKRDSFYHYSVPIQIGDTQYGNDLPFPDDSVKWIEEFHHGKYFNRHVYDYWLAPVKDNSEYTGYNEELKGKKYLIVNKNQIQDLLFHIPEKCRTNVDFSKSETYQIRVFKLGQKLFPIGLKAFRVSFAQYPVNFPPLTAKFLWEKFTEDFKNEEQIVVWDPSAGWGGRLLGVLSVTDTRHIKYVACDPNTDHNVDVNRTKYHEIYDFYTSNVRKGGLFPEPHNEFEFYQCGSEVIQYNEQFQKHKGKISVVFTSPPYFGKEAYSEDEEQSYKKFPQYELWKNGFLYETLKTAYEYLRPNGYLLWNIADAKFGNNMLPLEQDSIDICHKLGFKHIDTYKMSLAQMPGGNRIDTVTGLPKAKNTYKTNGLWLKYEPILIFKK
jgi:hypothetical protein